MKPIPSQVDPNVLFFGNRHFSLRNNLYFRLILAFLIPFVYSLKTYFEEVRGGVIKVIQANVFDMLSVRAESSRDTCRKMSSVGLLTK